MHSKNKLIFKDLLIIIIGNIAYIILEKNDPNILILAYLLPFILKSFIKLYSFNVTLFIFNIKQYYKTNK